MLAVGGLFAGLLYVSLSGVPVYGAIVNNPSTATDQNADGSGSSQYRSWPDSFRPGSTTLADSTIRYKFPPGANIYTAAEQNLIRAAMDQIEVDSGNCVKFESVPANYVTGPWLNLRPRAVATTPEKACRGSQGFQPNSVQNTTGQLLVLFSAANPNAGTTSVGACLDDQRDAMRLLVNSIGLMNEWRASKRNTFMIFPRNRNRLVDPDYQEFLPFDDSKLYRDSDITDTDASTFDSQSITMINPTRYAASANRPTFRLRGDLPAVPTTARLSVEDCRTIQLGLFNGRCIDPDNVKDCDSINPYDEQLADVKFFPSNIINRAIQCPQITSAATAPAGVLPVILGELVVDGLPVVALTGPTSVTLTARSATYTAYLTQLGIKAFLVVRQGRVQTPGTLGALCTTAAHVAAGCQYSIRFELSKLPDMNGVGSFQNQNAIVQLTSNSIVVQRLTATISINCAPVFRKLTAKVGPNAILTAEETYLYPEDIVAVTPPVKQASDVVRANDAGQLAQYSVNYNIPLGIGEKGGVAGASQAESPTKVFVNCNTGTVDGAAADPAAAAAQHLAGSTVIGMVEAVDPEGDEVSYFAFSTDPRLTSTADDIPVMTATGEMHSVSKDGVISISGFADPVEGAAVVGDGAANPVVNVGGGNDNPNAGINSAVAPVNADAARNVFIVAVDKWGAMSVLQARYYLACGVPIPA